MNAAFEILRLLVMETLDCDRPTLRLAEDTLTKLLAWIKKDPYSAGEKPEGRLRQGIVLFTGLIPTICRADESRRIVTKYRNGLEDHIKLMFRAELNSLSPPRPNLSFPYFERYMASRNLEHTSSD